MLNKTKKVEKKLSSKLKPELFKKAPNVNMLKPRPIAGVPNACLIPCLIDFVRINILFHPFCIIEIYLLSCNTIRLGVIILFLLA